MIPTFSLPRAARTAITEEVDEGSDTLDYSAYTTAVTVNLGGRDGLRGPPASRTSRT